MSNAVPLVPDPAQQRVLEHEDGPLLVLGGAGTGKTAVLRERFARLVEAGEDPERIALVVRSKRDRAQARAALLERLRAPMPSLGVFTAHALAFRILGRFHRALGYLEPPRVLSAADQFARVHRMLKEEDPADWPTYGGLLHLRGFADQVRQLLLRAQEELVTPDDLLALAERTGQHRWREIARFSERYRQALNAAGEVDFAGLLARAGEAVQPEDAPFAHVLVDDYQDVTRSFERLLERLAPASLVVAGDPEAHVFSFQGATDEPIRRFAEGFRAPVVELTTRHRGPEPEISGWRAPHASEEHAAIARELRRVHVQEGVPWRELAVITRRQDARAAALVRALEDAGIPHVELEGRPAPGSAPATVPYVLALRWLAADDEQRDELVMPLLTSSLARLSPASARALVRAARASNRPPRDALELTDGLSEAERTAVATLRAVLERASDVSASVLDAFGVLWRELPCSSRRPSTIPSRAPTWRTWSPSPGRWRPPGAPRTPGSPPSSRRSPRRRAPPSSRPPPSASRTPCACSRPTARPGWSSTRSSSRGPSRATSRASRDPPCSSISTRSFGRAPPRRPTGSAWRRSGACSDWSWAAPGAGSC